MAQSAPLVAHGGYGPPGGVGTLSWVGVGHGVAFGRVFGAVGGVRGVKVGQGGYGEVLGGPWSVEPLSRRRNGSDGSIWGAAPRHCPYGPIRSKYV